MNQVIQLLAEVACRGVVVRVDSGNIHLSPAARLTPELTAKLREHKKAVLREIRFNLLDEDLRYIFRERLAICTVDAGLSEEQAEEIAWLQIDEAVAARGESTNPNTEGTY